ncbi:MAG: aspartyl protease family protein [Acidobacteria bacterium]|nr:aspartyl protease family protein [Acidobacteriota bacterium]
MKAAQTFASVTGRLRRRGVGPRALIVLAVLAAAVAVPVAQTPLERAQQDSERGDRMFADAKYREAFDAYSKAVTTTDRPAAIRALKGMIKAALRLSSFRLARSQAEVLRASTGDAESLTLYGDALWADGLFDEAEGAYDTALERFPSSSRAHFGLARSLAARGRLAEALAEAERAMVMDPVDSDPVVLAGELYERLYRFDDAARMYERYVAMLPKRLRNDNNVAAMKIKLLRSFDGRVPARIDDEATAPLHTVPFTLKNKKIILRGTLNGKQVEMVLDTGAERTAITRAMANRTNIHGIAETMITGVGAPGVRRLSVARVDALTFGTLTVRDFPVSIRKDNMPGVPDWQNETFSPMSLGLSMVIDYRRQEVTFGRRLPDDSAEFTLPMRVYRLPMIRGMLNDKQPAYFIVDTGGELMSISTDVATALAMAPRRKIPLKVWGVTGLDRDAFLLPGVDLDFQDIAYRQQGVAVLNLRAPSVLLGFQVGGILGHRFLSGYRVAMDIQRGELRLQRSN